MRRIQAKAQRASKKTSTSQRNKKPANLFLKIYRKKNTNERSKSKQKKQALAKETKNQETSSLKHIASTTQANAQRASALTAPKKLKTTP